MMDISLKQGPIVMIHTELLVTYSFCVFADFMYKDECMKRYIRNNKNKLQKSKYRLITPTPTVVASNKSTVCKSQRVKAIHC